MKKNNCIFANCFTNMKLYEKIILILVAVAFCLHFLPIEDIWIPFTYATWILALSYSFAGFWLFNSKDKPKKKFLPIIAGIAFGISIFVIPHILGFLLEDWYYFCPIPNAILCIGLAFYLFINRKKDKININSKNIFKRSVIILLLCSFFVYTSKETIGY